MTRKLPHVGLGPIPDAEPMRSAIRGVEYGIVPEWQIRAWEHFQLLTDDREPIRVDATVGKAIREIEQDGEVI